MTTTKTRREAWGGFTLRALRRKQSLGFPGSSAGKESACSAGDPGLTLWSGKSSGEGTGYPFQYSWASLVAQMVKNLPAMWETWVRSLGWEDPLEKGTATQFSILAWKILMDRGAWWATVHGVAKSRLKKKRRKPSCQHLDCRLLGSKTLKNEFLFFLSYLVVVACYGCPPPKLTFYAFFFKTISCLPPSLLSALINTRTHHLWFYSETFLSHTIQRIFPPSRSPLDSLRRRKSIFLASLHLKVKVWNVCFFFF